MFTRRIRRCIQKFTQEHPLPLFAPLPRRVVPNTVAELLLRRRRGEDCGTMQGGSRLDGIVNCGRAFGGTFIFIFARSPFMLG